MLMGAVEKHLQSLFEYNFDFSFVSDFGSNFGYSFGQPRSGLHLNGGLWQRWVALVWLVTATHPRVCDPRSLTDGRKKALVLYCSLSSRYYRSRPLPVIGGKKAKYLGGAGSSYKS